MDTTTTALDTAIATLTQECTGFKCYWWKRVPGTARYPRFW